ncbi:hypothetical protein SEUCBS139899_002413 [Sporothrix eucalyptigena]|uniref:Uncharacterized protein n=1 Tax=Sporothrix eucalyptigena TaxID=1812306 RepID=A0ABP0B1L4_9PEZI
MSRIALLVGAASLAAAYDFGIPAKNLAGNAFANIDPDQQACETAGDVVTYCYDYLPFDAAATDSASCYCCDQTTFLAPVYSSCEDYITASAPEYTDDYSIVSLAQSLCLAASQEGFRCGAAAAATTTDGGGGATQTATGGATATGPVQTFGGGGGSGTAAGTAEPPACTSFADIFASCEENDSGFSTMDDSQAASCLCYQNGKFTTAFDSYISVCAVWAKTASPDQYESLVAVESFCEVFAGADSASATGSDVATFGGGGGGSSDSTANSITFNSGTATTKPTTTSSKTQKTVTVTPTSTSAAKNAGNTVARGGLAAWLAVVLPFVV